MLGIFPNGYLYYTIQYKSIGNLTSGSTSKYGLNSCSTEGDLKMQHTPEEAPKRRLKGMA